jgi:hypothetical protein
VKLYDDKARQLTIVTTNELIRLQQHFDEFKDKAEMAKLILEKRTQEYLDCGVAYNCTAFQAAFQMIPGSDPKIYFKEMSKELNRPFVYAEDTKTHGYFGGSYKYHEYTQLTVPATNRLKNIVAGMNLVARHDAMLGEGHGVTTEHSERTWRFRFEGEDAMQVLYDFLENCRTNPVYRITLGVGGNHGTRKTP